MIMRLLKDLNVLICRLLNLNTTDCKDLCQFGYPDAFVENILEKELK